MDEYDEKLVKWFDDEFWPMLARELAAAEHTARECTVSRPYWEGYWAALDMVNSFVDEGIERIKDSVEEEEANDD